MSHIKRKEILTICPFCGVGCNFYLQVEDEKIVGIVPARSHAVSRGRLCVGGWNAYEFIYHPDRIKKPLIKKGKGFKEASWSEAEDFVVRNLRRTRRTYGPEKIGVIASGHCINEEAYLLQKFARAGLGTNNIDHCNWTTHSSTVAGLKGPFGSAAVTNSVAELSESKCIFIIGANPLETHPIIGWRIITAKDRGAKIIVVDPRSTDLAKLADVHLKFLPGTDTALINAIINVILKNELEDKKFIDERTENFDELREQTDKYSPLFAQKITSVAKEDIIKAAKIYAENKPAAIVYSLGITEHIAATHNIINLANLAMLTGNIGHAGSGVYPLREQNNVQGVCDTGVLPDFLPGYQDVEDGHVLKRFEQHWKVKLPSKKGLKTSEMFERAGKIKAFYIVGEDVVSAESNSKDTARCLEKADFVVVHSVFMNATTELADVILPSSSFAEKDGTFTSMDRQVQLMRRAIEPLYHTKTDSAIIIDIAKKFGLKGMDYSNAADVMDEIAELVPIYGGISHARLEKQSLQWPCWSKTHIGTEYLHKGRFARGRGRFFGVEYKPPKERANKSYPFILCASRMPFQYNSGLMTRKTSILNREYAENFVEINKADAKKLGIISGSKVEIITRRDSISVKAHVSDDIKAGVIWMPLDFLEEPADNLAVDNSDNLVKIGEHKICAANIKLKK